VLLRRGAGRSLGLFSFAFLYPRERILLRRIVGRGGVGGACFASFAGSLDAGAAGAASFCPSNPPTV